MAIVWCRPGIAATTTTIMVLVCCHWENGCNTSAERAAIHHTTREQDCWKKPQRRTSTKNSIGFLLDCQCATAAAAGPRETGVNILPAEKSASMLDGMSGSSNSRITRKSTVIVRFRNGTNVVPTRQNWDIGCRPKRMMGTTDIEMKIKCVPRKPWTNIGFVWQVREPTWTQDERWNAMFQLLQDYQAIHGDCLVPIEYATKDQEPLGHWVRTQRRELANGKLLREYYQDRLQKLQSIGFALRVLPDDSINSRWDRIFGQLVAYQKRQHGDCLVPADYAGDLDQQQHQYPEDRVLRKFLSNLRVKGDTLPRDHREQLDAIGFVWDAQEASWNARFHELQRFQRQHGHCLVSSYQHDTDYPGLGNWVLTQRFSCHTMDSERIRQLDSIGFV
jgi:Helicase associated domain